MTEISSQLVGAIGVRPATKTIVAVIPAYNEARAISQVVLAMNHYVNTVLVVDDGSSDATAEMAAAAGAVVIKHDHNQGKGAAMRTGFREARKFNPDAVVTLDADGQHLPEETARVIAPVLSGRADLVVGSRYLKPTSQVPYHRVCGHYLFKLLINQFSGVSLTDTQSGFRAFSPKALQAVSFQSNGFAVESEMQFQAYKFHLKVTEAPITVRYYKEVKRSVLWQGFTVLAGVLRLALYYRPAFVYSLMTLLLILANLAGGFAAPFIQHPPLYLVQEYLRMALSVFTMGILILLVNTVLRPGRRFFIGMQSPEPEL
jgi:glycosyltransferase involved in cell wall biosynthesis